MTYYSMYYRVKPYQRIVNGKKVWVTAHKRKNKKFDQQHEDEIKYFMELDIITDKFSKQNPKIFDVEYEKFMVEELLFNQRGFRMKYMSIQNPLCWYTGGCENCPGCE